MTSTFSARTSDAPSQNTEQLTNSKPDFNVVSLLKEHPSRSSDARPTGSSEPGKLDFGNLQQLYGDSGHGHHDGGHHNHHDGNDGGQQGGADSIKDDPSLPVELVDAATEIQRAQDAYKNGDPERAKEWLKDADKNLRALTGDTSGSGGSSDQPCPPATSDTPSGSHDSGGGSDSHGSDGGSESPPPSDQQAQLQQMIATLAEALQALASGDMQKFQQLLSGLLDQVNQMLQPPGGADNGLTPDPSGGTEPISAVPGGGTDITNPSTGTGDGSINR